MSKDWYIEADKATARRQRLNTPWETGHPRDTVTPRCRGCGWPGQLSRYNPLFCDDCIKQAFDVVSNMET